MENRGLNNQNPAKSIFIRAPGAIGDALMLTAVIEGIKMEYPDLRIFILAKYTEIFANNPHVTSCYDRLRVYKINRSLYDISLYVRHCRAYEEHPSNRHLIDDLYDKIPLSISSRCYRPKIYLTYMEKEYKRRKIERLGRPLVAIAPFGKSNSKHPSKIYPVNQWRKVVNLLINKGLKLIQVGLKSEGPVLHGAQDWRNLEFRKTASVLSHCDAVITHVGGVMHLATACGVPCVTLYAGVEDPKVTGYIQNLNLCVNLDCAPCWRSEMCSGRECMGILTPQKIVSETMRLLTDTIVKTE
jgi:ADP-heptose:LPS heptosyltransferase